MCWKLPLHTLALLAFLGPVQTRDTPPTQGFKDVYTAVGLPVNVACEDGTTKGSEWRINGLLHATGPVLHFDNTSLDDQGFYTCHDSNGDIITKIHLHLGYPPAPPDVFCWSPSYPLKTLCSWSLKPDPLLPTHYISTYWYHEALHPCLRESEQSSQCVIQDPDLYSDEPYVINITAVNALGSASHLLPMFIEETVKPDPPVNVKVTALPGKKLNVQWLPPPTWPDPVNFPLSYHVQFQWGNPIMANIMGPFESENMVRSGIVAGRTYHIRVSCMDFLGHGQRSEWSQSVNITLPKT